MALLLGVDPGFANMGWCLVEATENRLDLVGAGLISTEKSSSKGTTAMDDNLRRMREVARALRAVPRIHEVAVVCAESQSWPRNAAASAKIGMAWGVLTDFAEHFAIPITTATPMAVKAAVTGKKTASKEEVISCITQVDGLRRLRGVLLKMPKTKQEHVADAAAAIVACRRYEIVRAVLRAHGGTR